MNTYQAMIEMAKKQFALDYNCSEQDFNHKETLVTLAQNKEGARKFEDPDNFLSILSFQGKLVITANEKIKEWCEEILAKQLSAEWGFEAENLILIDRKLQEYGYQIDQAHIFFLPKEIDKEEDQDISLLSEAEIEELEDDERIDEAFLFEDYIDDVLGAVIKKNDGTLAAVAGATNNGQYLWEMGVNSFEEGKGYAKRLIRYLSREVYDHGKVPYCGTALSHLASQNVMLRAGFVPAFCELRVMKAE